MKTTATSHTIITTLLFFLAGQATGQPLMVRVFIANAKTLMSVQKDMAGNKSLQFAVKRLRHDADKALDVAPVSVMDKSQTAGSGDKHDYLSLGRYWWPDPNKPDGLPYIQRDGEVNPEAATVSDRENLQKLTKSVETLGLAYFFIANEEYAEHATQMLRTWFLNPETRMNPNLEFGQIVRGKDVGRASGLIDVRGLADLIDGVGLLAGSRSWTPEDQKALVGWFDQYLVWLQTSKIGRKEAESDNNHGVWFDVQRTSIALFVGKYDLARRIVEEAKTKRIAQQIEPDGTQPRELARTRSMHYTAFVLEAYINLALLGESLGVDLWNYQTADGRGIRKAFEWFLPYYADEKAWTLEQIDKFKGETFYPVFHIASVKFADEKYMQAGLKHGGEKAKTDRVQLMCGN